MFDEYGMFHSTCVCVVKHTNGSVEGGKGVVYVPAAKTRKKATKGSKVA